MEASLRHRACLRWSKYRRLIRSFSGWCFRTGLSLLLQVTVGAGGGRLSYAFETLRELDLKLSSNELDFPQRDDPMDEAIAVRTQAGEVAGLHRQGRVIGHQPGWRFW